jgi:2-dehydro-3-deoxyphosphogalactonate aldolase
LVSDFSKGFLSLPLVAILRGVAPDEVVPIGTALFHAGFRLIEVPLNSPRPLESIERLVVSLPGEAVIGAGTVLSCSAADQVLSAGGRMIVMPHADIGILTHAKAKGAVCIPGAATPTEVFACAAAGADAVKLFPAELFKPDAVKALRAVVPSSLRLLPVGGVRPESMAAYRNAGASGFGLGGSLYAPGMSAKDVEARALSFVTAWRNGLEERACVT